LKSSEPNDAFISSSATAQASASDWKYDWNISSPTCSESRAKWLPRPRTARSSSCAVAVLGRLVGFLGFGRRRECIDALGRQAQRGLAGSR
jgi:hypothetical protein